MDEAADASGSVLAARLDTLLAHAPRPGGGTYTLREVADGINQAEGERLVSATYLSQLRTGARANPGYRRLQAIAAFFGVPVEYFSDEDVARRTDEELRLLGKMRDAGVRGIMLRAEGLSDGALEAVRTLMDHYRSREGLPPAEQDR